MSRQCAPNSAPSPPRSQGRTSRLSTSNLETPLPPATSALTSYNPPRQILRRPRHSASAPTRSPAHTRRRLPSRSSGGSGRRCRGTSGPRSRRRPSTSSVSLRGRDHLFLIFQNYLALMGLLARHLRHDRAGGAPPSSAGTSASDGVGGPGRGLPVGIAAPIHIPGRLGRARLWAWTRSGGLAPMERKLGDSSGDRGIWLGIAFSGTRFLLCGIGS
jgi:hypothetical protein